jgi:octaprenyl-diphosphate synthase
MTGAVQTTRDIFRLVELDLGRIDSELRKHSNSDVSVVTETSRYVHSSGGKRLRPALLLIVSKLCGYDGEAAIKLGVVVEQIHAATLVHDDIIDNATLRRGRPSLNALWDNSVTVLVGDWLYMTSFQLALQLRNFRVLDILIGVTRKMVEGELMQLRHNGRTDITAAEQLEICSRKTACLFAGCAQLGAILGRVSEEHELLLEQYGRSLGMAFQLTDDLLDYTADETSLGKPVLKDLDEGRITLPITYLLERASRVEQDFVRQVIRERAFNIENKQRIIELVQRYETGRELKQLAGRYAEEAKACLSVFPDSAYRDALLRIPDFVIARQS